jgi:DNA polymerase-3 subunit delta'
MPFAEILGQAEALRQLQRAVETQRLAHAYLFEGPPGVGKSMTARALARMLLCPQKGACGGCDTCRRIAEHTHPLVRTYGLQKNSRNIGVDAIRDDLIPFFGFKSAPGEYRVAIVDPADALSMEAANMLLKTLEEPGQWSLLVLLVRTAEALLPTIRSRCQRIRFARIPERLIAERLREKMDIAPDHARVAAKLSGGSMGRAFELAGRDFSAWRSRALDAFAGLITGRQDPVEAARALLDMARESARGLQEQRIEVQQLLDLVLSYLRDLAIAEEKCESLLLNDDRQTLAAEAAVLDEQRVFEIFDRIFEARNDVENNVNMQLALQELCFQTSEIAGGRSSTDA